MLHPPLDHLIFNPLSLIVLLCSSLSPLFAFLFKQRLASEGRNDTLIGHLIVLLQYDWPREEGTFYELLEKIRDNRGLKYRVFFDYVNSILWLPVVHLISFC